MSFFICEKAEVNLAVQKLPPSFSDLASATGRDGEAELVDRFCL
jgi:hypothetical protein